MENQYAGLKGMGLGDAHIKDFIKRLSSFVTCPHVIEAGYISIRERGKYIIYIFGSSL